MLGFEDDDDDDDDFPCTGRDLGMMPLGSLSISISTHRPTIATRERFVALIDLLGLVYSVWVSVE